MMDKMEKAKAGMPQKTSIEISRMIAVSYTHLTLPTTLSV